MNKLYAAFSRGGITPMLDIGIAGYYRSRYAEGISDALEINAFTLAYDEDRAVNSL